MYPHENTIHIHFGTPSHDLSSAPFDLYSDALGCDQFYLLKRAKEGGDIAIGGGCSQDPIYVKSIPTDIYVTRGSQDMANLTIVLPDGSIVEDTQRYFYTNVLGLFSIDPFNYDMEPGYQICLFKELKITLHEGVLS